MTDATEGEGTWNRLTRRKVVQWGAAYAAGAWGFLQGLQYVSDAFGWPSQLRQVAILALLIGLPVALVIAWYHGDRGEQRVTATELTILTMLFVLGGGIFWRYQQVAVSSPGAALATVRGPSIAVLPFKNRSDQRKDAYFVDGIHDDVLTQLTKIGAIKVIARTSVEQFRNTKLTTKAIGERLGVGAVLEGGVQRAGDRVRISVQLVDTATDTHLWAENYDRELTAANIFAIQSEVAAAIAYALKATLTPSEMAQVRAVPTRSLQAWEAYQLGKQRMAHRASAGLSEAEQFFKKAIDLDPKFALAYVGLADALILQTYYVRTPSDATLARADAAAGAALQLDPKLAEAWTSSAKVASDNNQFDRAEPMFRKAIELNPNYATAHHWYSGFLADRDRMDEALGYAEKAAALDPLSAIINSNLATMLAASGRFAEAEARYRKAISIDPAMPLAYLSIVLLDAYVLNRFADAVPILKKACELEPDNPIPMLWQAGVLLDFGDVSNAIRSTRAIQKRWPDDGWVNSVAAIIYASQGDLNAAVRSAGKGLEIDPRDTFALFVLDIADFRKGDARTARSRYAQAYPELLAAAPPTIDASNYATAIALASVLQRTGEAERAKWLLDGSEQVIRTKPRRLGSEGYGILDVKMHALRGDKIKALTALREAKLAGWRGPLWHYARNIDPHLASIRNDPEFKAVFADIERDMASQRAELAARSEDAPLALD